VTFSANGQPVAVWKKVGSGTAARYSLHTNHLGSVVHVGNSSGARIDSGYALYEPFGAYTLAPTGTNPSVTDRGFTGHRQNNIGAYNLGLIYMNARYCHPQLGRFVSPDTIVPEPENPQSYNRYAFVHNNPLNFTDPTGHMQQRALVNDGGAQGFGGAALLQEALIAGMSWAAIHAAYQIAYENPDIMWARHDAMSEERDAARRESAKALGGGGTASPNPDDFDPQEPGNGGGGNWRDLVPEERRKAVQEAFKGEPQAVTVQEDTIVYRYHNPGQPATEWYSPTQYNTPAEAQQHLALPASNTATEMSQYILPRGTRVLYGEVQSKVGDAYFHPHATGGGMQYYVPDFSKLQLLP
jgi:RHS repeat-associated protein